jgi:high affinity Mn2+ porin
MRFSWNDGKNETWCFTEIDQSIALGASLKGTRWKRSEDVLGFACVVNGISNDHREYLRAGGLGFILGDGTLSYAPEAIAEVYYSCLALKSGLWLSGDYQLCFNPGYNKDRGPANIISIRAHIEL